MSSTISFPNIFEPSSGTVKLATNDTSYRQCLKSVFLSNVGELLGDPSFGCRLKENLFELKSTLTKTMLFDAMVSAAKKYVPEVTLTTLDIYQDDGNFGTTYIAVYYYTINRGENDYVELAVMPDGTVTTR